jgi:hypothetical protein
MGKEKRLTSIRYHYIIPYTPTVASKKPPGITIISGGTLNLM